MKEGYEEGFKDGEDHRREQYENLYEKCRGLETTRDYLHASLEASRAECARLTGELAEERRKREEATDGSMRLDDDPLRTGAMLRIAAKRYRAAEREAKQSVVPDPSGAR
jgi:predicted phosphoribosyltransferase